MFWVGFVLMFVRVVCCALYVVSIGCCVFVVVCGCMFYVVRCLLRVGSWLVLVVCCVLCVVCSLWSGNSSVIVLILALVFARYVFLLVVSCVPVAP